MRVHAEEFNFDIGRRFMKNKLGDGRNIHERSKLNIFSSTVETLMSWKILWEAMAVQDQLVDKFRTFADFIREKLNEEDFVAKEQRKVQFAKNKEDFFEFTNHFIVLR